MSSTSTDSTTCHGGPNNLQHHQHHTHEPPFPAPQPHTTPGQTFASMLLLSFSCAPLLKQHLLRTLHMSDEELISFEPIIAAAWDHWDNEVQCCVFSTSIPLMSFLFISARDALCYSPSPSRVPRSQWTVHFIPPAPPTSTSAPPCAPISLVRLSRSLPPTTCRSFPLHCAFHPAPRGIGVLCERLCDD